MKRFLLIFLLTFIPTLLAGQTTYRYTDSLFTAVQTHTDLGYATAPELNSPYMGESATHKAGLTMHIFQPADDELALRPMLICAHGGAFVTGNKEHDDMMAFCREFASRGYVTATMQYRLGMNPASRVSGERAVYRALQDSRTAIRFIREKAAEFGVDTSRVYFLGSSAGAFIGLHNLFMNETAERPASTGAISTFPPTSDNGPDLGGYDAIKSQYNHNAHPNAVIALWGALKDTTLIKKDDEKIPVFLVHGTDDIIVPFGLGHPFQAPALPGTFGSKTIAEKFKTIGYPHETYFVKGVGHEFYGVHNGQWHPTPNAYWDSVLTKSSHFLYQQHKPQAAFEFTTDSYTVHFTDQSSEGTLSRYWTFGDGETSTEQHPIHNYSQSGTYRVRLYIENEISSWDTTSTLVSITETAVQTAPTLPVKTELINNFPNPFNASTTITYSLAKAGYVGLNIYNITGRRVKSLVNEYQTPGRYSLHFNAEHLPSGLYFYRLRINDQIVSSKKMGLLK
ncbi:carboxylesterase family protein [candidate division KSB1 bacterium]|nr:carboxylesterase family protein [candidate division KSB1 bacterium]